MKKNDSNKGLKWENNLKFDFYLPTKNIAIEYDGIQHYKPIKIFGGEKFLKKQKIKDKIKNNFCKKNNIILIRIPYWKKETINEILNRKINI